MVMLFYLTYNQKRGVKARSKGTNLRKWGTLKHSVDIYTQQAEVQPLKLISVCLI